MSLKRLRTKPSVWHGGGLLTMPNIKQTVIARSE